MYLGPRSKDKNKS